MPKMTRRFLYYCMVLMAIAGGSNPAQAYVPDCAQIINQYLKTTGYAKTLDVRQTRVYFDSRIEEGSAEFEEKAKYVFPDRFRSDIIAETTNKTTITTFDKALVILDNMVASEREERFGAYKDVLLFRNSVMLMARLQRAGIDTDQTRFTRFEDRIALAVGAKSELGRNPSQLYFDKKTFLPLRLFLNPTGNEDDALEILFLEWKTYGKTKFPSKIEFFKNHTLVRELRIKGITCDVPFDETLFDIDTIKAALEEKKIPEQTDTGEQPDNEIKKTIDDLDKIIEKDPMAF